MRTVLAVPVLLALAACASDPPAAADPKVVCTYEAPTGSTLKVRRCWTEEQTAQQQQDVRALGESISRVRPSSPGGR